MTSFLPPDQPTHQPVADDGSLRPLDLAQPKDIGALITSAWRIWKARPGLFLASAMVVGLVPYAIYGMGRAYFDHNEDAVGVLIVTVAFGIIGSTVVSALITASHARAVVALANGRDLSRSEALREARPVLGAVVGVGLLYFAAIIGGFVLFFFPGAYIAVAGAFGTIVVALTPVRGWAAVKQSIALVKVTGWWLTWGRMILLSIVGTVLGYIPVFIASIVAAVSDSLAVDLAAGAVEGLGMTVIASWTALTLTLLFFSMRARAGDPWTPEGGGGPALDLTSAAQSGSAAFVRPGQPAPSAQAQAPGIPGAGGQAQAQEPCDGPPPGGAPTFRRPGQ